ncbi:flavodoxin family protein [Kitasatospora sp. NPDC058965]|uniref:flavodoxin family protein n=1 Tax=Kitasatospora sp. NPDC058965 TaxID=3346682 RepID=UPI0036980671
MKTVIVYESVYGNTHEVAEAIAEGVREARPDATVACVPVGRAGPEVTRGADLLVVGGPTHMHGMSSGLSRRSAVSGEAKKARAGKAAHRTEAGAEGPGLRNWFKALPKTEPGTHAAAFDTRADSRLAGAAAEGIARRLDQHEYHVLVDPEGFVVEESEGPLRAGELARAKVWGAGLV